MKKFYIMITIFVLLSCGINYSFAKYNLNHSAKVFHIESFADNSTGPATLSGRILTENIHRHLSLVTLYKTSDTNHEQPISQIETNEDGSFSFTVTDITMYDIVVSKSHYLNYTVLQIKLRPGRTIILPDYKLLAGDFVVNGIVDINDWIQILNHMKKPVNSTNKHFDINDDGRINEIDRDIVRSNYPKSAETVIWSK